MRSTAIVLVLAGVWASPSLAHADAIPPPSVLCAKGDRVVNDHSGGHCVPTKCPPGKVLAPGPKGYDACLPPAPKDCPAGWTGVPGPHCTLRLCGASFTPCEAGSECREAPVCTTDDPGYSRNDGLDAPAKSLFGGDRAVVPSREYIGPCDASLACGAREVCRSVRVCLPKGAERPVARPANAISNRIWGTSSIPADEPPVRGGAGTSKVDAGSTERDAGGAAPVVAAPPPAPAPAPVAPQSGRGSAGCDVVAAPGTARTMGALGALAGLMLFARLRRKPTTSRE